MCLKTTWDKPEIATEDIVCYKIVFKSSFRIGEFVSVFHTFYYKLKRLNRLESDRQAEFEKSNKGRQEIGFHSYVEEPVLSEDAYNKAIIKCIIPKGSLYYKGLINNSALEGYCSDGIIADEVINDTVEPIVDKPEEEVVNFN